MIHFHIIERGVSGTRFVGHAGVVCRVLFHGLLLRKKLHRYSLLLYLFSLDV